MRPRKPARKRTSKEVGLALGFRSGLEEATGEQIASAGLDPKAIYESVKIEYVKPSRKSKYTPDWPLPNGIIVETKGRFEVADRQKHLLIKEQHPHLDIRFVFSNPNTRIRKGSPTTYADWCEKHGFLYAAKRIPEEWLK
jgi:hypothetical protein